MIKILILLIAPILLLSENTGVISKTETGFIMKPKIPFVEKTCEIIPISNSETGFLFTGRIIWGESDGYPAKGSPYANKMVFVSEGKTREWEYIVSTDENGTFSIPIKPYTQFKLYAWDGTSDFFAKYDGHFYYNSELHNLYQTPTGGEPFIAEKGDVVVVEVDN